MHTSLKATAMAAAITTVMALSPIAQAAGKHRHGSEFGSQTKHKQHITAQFTDYAKVTHVQPIYRRVKHQKPSQQCWYEHTEHTTHYRDHNPRQQRRSAGQTIVGGIVGGVIGNQIGRHVGSHRARVGATVAGAIFGSALANEGHRRHGRPGAGHTVTETRPVKHCKQVYETQYTQKLVGYTVTYRYRGRTHITQMKRDPGKRLPVHVSISPQG